MHPISESVKLAFAHNYREILDDSVENGESRIDFIETFKELFLAARQPLWPADEQRCDLAWGRRHVPRPRLGYSGAKVFCSRSAQSRDKSRNHSAAAAIALIANFAPELSGIVTALFPALLEVFAKLFDFAWLALRFATFRELAGSQKAADCLALEAEHAADRFL